MAVSINNPPTIKTVLDFTEPLDLFINNIEKDNTLKELGFVQNVADTFCENFVLFLLYKCEDIYNNFYTDNHTKLNIIDLWNRLINGNRVINIIDQASQGLIDSAGEMENEIADP